MKSNSIENERNQIGNEKSWTEKKRNSIEHERNFIENGKNYIENSIGNERHLLKLKRINGFDTVLIRFLYGFFPNGILAFQHPAKNRMKTVWKPYQNR